MNENINKIVEKAIAGDKAASIEIIKQEQNNIYTTLYYLKKNDDELFDIMQDILIKLYNKITQLKNPKYFKTWLNQIIINSYYDYLRRLKKNKRIELSNNTELFEKADYNSNPQDSVLYSELDMIIKNSIENLPIHYKIPITLREVQGLSYNEISGITNTTIGTVKSRIARAREIIQEKINQYAKE